jgi:hypothetical protein
VGPQRGLGVLCAAGVGVEAHPPVDLLLVLGVAAALLTFSWRVKLATRLWLYSALMIGRRWASSFVLTTMYFPLSSQKSS